MPAGPPPTTQQRTFMVRFGCRSDVIATAIQVSIEIRLSILARFRPKAVLNLQDGP
jgi:hypothetical protein